VIAHFGRNLVNRKVLAYSVPNDSSRFSAHPSSHVALFQERHRIVQPEEFDNRSRFPSWVHGFPTAPVEYRLTATNPDIQDPPPIWNVFERAIEMPLGDDQGNLVEHPSVEIDLLSESPQGVAVRLYLVSVNESVDDSNIHTGLATAQSQLFSNKGT
jgi:hypothetical protein